ncbi:MAG: hypothetical protein ACREKL_04255 [Chthoniobacterales bacterium]
MRRPFAAMLLAALAAVAVTFEAGSTGAPVRNFFSAWLGANAVPETPGIIAVVEIPQANGIPALDAALILRAVMRYDPRAVAFLVPVRLDGNEPLLASKLAASKIPVTFTSNDRPEPLPGVAITSSLPQLPRLPAFVPRGSVAGGSATAPAGHVLIVARQGAHAVASNVLCLAAEKSKISGGVPGDVQAGSMLVPVDSAGLTKINPIAREYVERIPIGQLMLETERSEGGSISTVLDAKFRGRLVAVQAAGQNSAEGTAAILNHLVERPVPDVIPAACVLLAALLPWWSATRRGRVMLAFVACCGWALLALAVYQEFQMAMPLLPATLLPLLALIPPGSNKAK